MVYPLSLGAHPGSASSRRDCASHQLVPGTCYQGGECSLTPAALLLAMTSGPRGLTMESGKILDLHGCQHHIQETKGRSHNMIC